MTNIIPQTAKFLTRPNTMNKINLQENTRDFNDTYGIQNSQRLLKTNKQKSVANFRSTSMNAGPFSVHQQLINQEGNNFSMNPNLSQKIFKLNSHNNEIIEDFARNPVSYRFKNNKQNLRKIFTRNLKKIEDKTLDFAKSNTKNRYYLNREYKNYDGFDGYTMPKIEGLYSKKRGSSASLQNFNSGNEKFNKNYEKLLNSLQFNSPRGANKDNEKQMLEICKKENNNLKQIIKNQIKIPLPIPVSMKDNHKVTNIHVGRKIIISRDRKKETSIQAPIQNVRKGIGETTHVPHVEGNTFITNLNRNNYT